MRIFNTYLGITHQFHLIDWFSPVIVTIINTITNVYIKIVVLLTILL
jgi:hypothetical protein